MTKVIVAKSLDPLTIAYPKNNCETADSVGMINQPCNVDGQYYAVNPLVLRIEDYQPVRMTERELRSPPRFLQTSKGQLNKDLNLPFGYMRFVSKMLLKCLQYSNLGGNPRAYGIFQEPDYKAMSELGEDQVKQFLRELSELIWEAYDVEWWFILKERAYHRRRNTNWTGFDNVDLTLANFPANVTEYDEWSRHWGNHGLVECSVNYSNEEPEILNLGEQRSAFMVNIASYLTQPIN
jgi:hypothetical protein